MVVLHEIESMPEMVDQRDQWPDLVRVVHSGVG